METIDTRLNEVARIAVRLRARVQGPVRHRDDPGRRVRVRGVEEDPRRRGTLLACDRIDYLYFPEHGLVSETQWNAFVSVTPSRR
jgi:hypothetical protein